MFKVPSESVGQKRTEANPNLSKQDIRSLSALPGLSSNPSCEAGLFRSNVQRKSAIMCTHCKSGMGQPVRGGPVEHQNQALAIS